MVAFVSRYLDCSSWTAKRIPAAARSSYHFRLVRLLLLCKNIVSFKADFAHLPPVISGRSVPVMRDTPIFARIPAAATTCPLRVLQCCLLLLIKCLEDIFTHLKAGCAVVVQEKLLYASASIACLRLNH